MFTVKTPEEARGILRETVILAPGTEEVPLEKALGRVLAEPLTAREYVPDFQRSTVDGYAVKASDTFGCSESLPAMLLKAGEVRMGEPAGFALDPGECAYVPTGGEVPAGADAVVMIEYTDDYGDGIVGMLRPCAPGENMIFRGDDLKPGQEVLPAGTRLRPKDIGALSSMGVTLVPVRRKIRAAVLSTGDELVPADRTPEPGQIRNVNSALLCAMVQEAGAEAVDYGIIPDQDEKLREALHRAVKECDLVLVSGGSSVGTRDLTCRILEECGRILFHGISMKPGKPTIFGMAGKPAGEGPREVPVFGLPGHPGAAFFVAEVFLLPLLRGAAAIPQESGTRAVLAENLSANHGRAQYMAARLEQEGDTLYARPVYMKSGMITALSDADGYFFVPRDTEGLPKGAEIEVMKF